MPKYKARQGKDTDGNPVYGAPFVYEPRDPASPAAENRNAKVASGEWVEVEKATTPKPLEKRNVGELKEYAAEHDVDLGEATKKADILAAIKAAQAGDPGDPGAGNPQD